jgi:hypothetical protein
MSFLMAINPRILMLEDGLDLNELIKLRYFITPMLHIVSNYIMYPIIQRIVNNRPMSYIGYRGYYYRSSLHYRRSSIHYHSVG